MDRDYYTKEEILDMHKELLLNAANINNDMFIILLTILGIFWFWANYIITQKVKEVEKLKRDTIELKDFLNWEAIGKYSEKIYQEINWKKLDDLILHPENLLNLADELFSISIKGDSNMYKLINIYNSLTDELQQLTCLVVIFRNYPLETIMNKDMAQKIISIKDDFFYVEKSNKHTFHKTEMGDIIKKINLWKEYIDNDVYVELQGIFTELQQPWKK